MSATLQIDVSPHIPVMAGNPDHSKDPKNYVLGAAIDPDNRTVVTIVKNSPEWQRGRQNFPGGKIEPFDVSPAAAMSREFNEETGLLIQPFWWNPVALVEGVGWNMHVFYTYSDKIHRVRTVEKEFVLVRTIKDVLADDSVLPSLKLYLPLISEQSRGLILPLKLKYRTVF